MTTSYILAFSPTDAARFGGGLPKFINEEAALAAERGISTATVFPLRLASWSRVDKWTSGVWGLRFDGRWQGMFTWRNLLRVLGAWQRRGRLLREIQIHYLGNYPVADFRSFFAALPEVPVRLWIHDFHTLCRSVHLWRGDEEGHCGDAPPSPAKCEGCPRLVPGWFDEMRATLDALHPRLRVVAPSESAARIWRNAYPGFADCLRVVPHLAAVKTGRGTAGTGKLPLKLCYAGTPTAFKGWDAWKRLASALRERGAPLELLYFGVPTSLPEGVRRVEPAPGGLVETLRRERVDFLFLWALLPETYSYVYFEALQAGAWPLANPAGGNIPDAIRSRGWGSVFDDEAQAVDFLSDSARMLDTLRLAREVERPLRMTTNPAILDDCPEPREWPLPQGFPRRSFLREAVWRLKNLTGHA